MARKETINKPPVPEVAEKTDADKRREILAKGLTLPVDGATTVRTIHGPVIIKSNARQLIIEARDETMNTGGIITFGKTPAQ